MLEASVGWAIWVTGPPGSGKTTLVRRVAATLEARGLPVKVLELDEIRKVITPAPTYSDAEREVVYRALAYMAKLVTEAGVPVLIDATAHRRAWRELARRLIPVFAEVQPLCPPEVCRAREERRSPGDGPRSGRALGGLARGRADLEDRRVRPLDPGPGGPAPRAEALPSGNVPQRVRGERSEEHTSELQSPLNLVC